MQTQRTTLVTGLVLLFTAAALHAAEGPSLEENHYYTPGNDRSMLLLQGDLLIRLASDGVTEKERRRLGAKYSHIAERADHFVALSEDPKAVVMLNKKTLKPIRKQTLQYMKLRDLALHPKLPVTYIAVEFQLEAPSFRVIAFNEETGEAHEPRGFYGRWVRVHPAGTFLVTGHADIYERGTRFFINPGWQLHTVPDYGSIDLLISYALDDKGMPTFIDLKTKAGGNGQGMRMSPDGERVTYLSHVGYPQFSGNLGGFDPLDLQKLPVNYATKDRATTYDLAYHPSLPLCASPGTDTVVFFHREKGDIEDRLDKSVRFDKLHRVYFSPDGKQVVVDSELKGVRALRSALLKLSREELARVIKPTDYSLIDNAEKIRTAMVRARREIDKKIEPEKAARDKAVDWIKLNNTLGPDHKIVTDQGAVIDEELAGGRNFYMIFGKGLVKADTPTFLCVWSGTLFTLPLTPQQEQAFEFPKMTLVKKSGGKAGWRLTEPRAQLSDLKFIGADGVDGKAKLTGTVKCKTLELETGHYALKLDYIVGDTRTTSYHHLGEYLARDEEEIKFSFSPVVQGKTAHKGPMPVFMELVVFATADRQSEAAIASNTVAQIVTIKPPAP